MQTSILSLVLVLGAFQVVAQYTNQSAPFNLVLCSSNATLNGALLGACHEDAAIEGLCPSIGGNASASYNQFNFNYTSKQTPDPVFGITGLLVCAPPLNLPRVLVHESGFPLPPNDPQDVEHQFL